MRRSAPSRVIRPSSPRRINFVRGFRGGIRL